MEFYSTADYSTPAWAIVIPFAGGCWARRQPRNGVKDVSVVSKLRISLISLEGVLGSMLVEFYSKADYSTSARRIQIRFAGGYWARRQLCNGIKDIPVASKPRI